MIRWSRRYSSAVGRGDNYWGRLQQRRVSRRRFLAGGGVAAAGSAALLAGCGGDSPTPAPVVTEAPTRTETSPPTVTETPETTATTTATTTPTPDPLAYRRGGTLQALELADGSGLGPRPRHLPPQQPGRDLFDAHPAHDLPAHQEPVRDGRDGRLRAGRPAHARVEHPPGDAVPQRRPGRLGGGRLQLRAAGEVERCP